MVHTVAMAVGSTEIKHTGAGNNGAVAEQNRCR